MKARRMIQQGRRPGAALVLTTIRPLRVGRPEKDSGVDRGKVVKARSLLIQKAEQGADKEQLHGKALALSTAMADAPDILGNGGDEIVADLVTQLA